MEPPPPIIFDFCLFFVLGLGKGYACPAGLGKRFSQGSAGLEPPAGARIRKKNEKSKLRGGGVLCSKSKIRESPKISIEKLYFLKVISF